MTQSRFYILAEKNITYGPGFKYREGFETLEEAQQSFHEVREAMAKIHGELYSPETKWGIYQKVMDIPQTQPAQYSFQPLALTSQSEPQEIESRFGHWERLLDNQGYSRRTQAYEALALKSFHTQGDYKAITLSPSEFYILASNMIAVQLWDAEFSNWLETNQTNIEDEIPF